MPHKIISARICRAAIIACLASASTVGCNDGLDEQDSVDDVADIAVALDEEVAHPLFHLFDIWEDRCANQTMSTSQDA